MVNKIGIIIFSIVAIISIFSILGISFNQYVEAQTENNTNTNTNTTTTTNDTLTDIRNLTTVSIYLKDARDNTFTGGLTYTPDYVTFKNSQNTTQHFSIASGYSRVSVSESDFSYTFSMKVPVKDQPTAFAISDVNLRADVLYIDTLSNAAPEYVEEFQIANPDDLYVYYGEVTNISFSPDPELNDLLSDRTLWQTSPSTAVIIGYVEE